MLIYHTALYLRLSKDDTDINGSSKTESNSISSQRELLRAYVGDHEDLRLFDIYIDDGYSGANFERPEFRRMMEDVRAGKVNCVLVKDLSRFGRDYIEAGRLIQKTFPAFSVRFIAVTDHYDSLYADQTERSLILPVKNFVNDSYCRDISIKVRAQQKVKRMEGKCIAAFAVYGYRKDPEDRNKLIADNYAADVVQRIFAWKISGMSMGTIAERLNHLGILSPMEYKKSMGIKYYTGFGGGKTPRWAAASVKRILENRTYTGTLVQGKQEKINYKLKKRIDLPKEEWICVKDTHEAIIPKWEFDLVQELLLHDGRTSEGADTFNLFSGILFCADCKAPMIKRVNHYKGKKKVYYICRTKNRSLGCSRHSIEEEKLKIIIFKEIKKFFKLMVTDPQVLAFLDGINVNDERAEEYDRQIERLRLEFNKYSGLKHSLSADLRDGLIDQREYDEFYSLYEKKSSELDDSITAQKRIIQERFRNSVLAKARLDKIRETLEPRELSRELLVTAVQKIDVRQGKGLDITFRFSNIWE